MPPRFTHHPSPPRTFRPQHNMVWCWNVLGRVTKQHPYSSPTLRACWIPVRPLPKPHHSQGGLIANGAWSSHSGQTTDLGGEPGRELHSRQSSQPDWPRDARLGFYMVSCVPKTNTSNMNSNKKAKTRQDKTYISANNTHIYKTVVGSYDKIIAIYWGLM